ncbi:MAG: efflux RND transporter periplasmic adaptor subunit [bacterium]
MRRKKWFQVIFSLILLGVVLLGTILVVRHFKKPGQMTLLESQAMDMSGMAAPVGSVPVAVEKVRRGPFSSEVTCTGSVVAFNEQEVSPRVSGLIEKLFVYPGDKVSRGQLVALLKAPELEAQVEEGAGRYGASREDLSSAREGVKKAQAEQEETRAGLNSARADLNYQEADIKREKVLYENGAISKDEYQAELAKYKASRAARDAAQSRLAAAEASRKAARFQRNRADAMTREAGASLKYAGILRGYSEVRSSLSGVVTQRLMSIGSLAAPGSVIYRIAEINPIRLQANVAEGDMQGIKIGNRVFVSKDKNSPPFETKITAVFPAADAVSRTSLVEALAPNPSQAFLPGQYLIMRIARESKASTLTVPSSALVETGEGKAVWIIASGEAAGKIKYTCPMHPEVISDKPGQCPKCGMDLVPKESAAQKGKAHLAAVHPGLSNGERTEILLGLKEDDQVIYAGQEYLHEGDSVYPTEWGAEGPIKLPPAPAMENTPGMQNMPGMDNMPESSPPAMEHHHH